MKITKLTDKQIRRALDVLRSSEVSPDDDLVIWIDKKYRRVVEKIVKSFYGK